MTTYAGYDVLEVTDNRDKDPDQKYSRALVRLDAGYGKVAVFDKNGVTRTDKSFQWFMGDRSEIATFKAFVAARKGQAVPFWILTGQNDVQMTLDALTTDSAITIKPIGYTKFLYGSNNGRRHLAFQFPDGTYVYRKITGATDNVVSETLALNSALGRAVPASTIVSFLTLCRLSADDATMSWTTTTVGEAILRFMEIPNEAP